MKIDYENTPHFMEKKSVKITTFLNLFSGIMLLIMVITMMIWCFHHDAKVVSGQSMQPTINLDFSEENDKFDIVIINKTQNIKRQDIVIIDFSDYNKDELIIKRVIAVGGDTIKIVWNTEKQKSEVYLKEKGEIELKLLDEPYTQSIKRLDGKTCAKTFSIGSTEGKYNSYVWSGYELNDDGSITIKDGYFFALGDNRELSLDGSEVGPFATEKLVGVVETIEHEGSFVNKFIRTIFNLGLSQK